MARVTTPPAAVSVSGWGMFSTPASCNSTSAASKGRPALIAAFLLRRRLGRPQVVGIVVSLGFGIVTALVMSFILKHTIGMDVSDDAQAEGLDKVYWDIEPDVDPVTDNKP